MRSCGASLVLAVVMGVFVTASGRAHADSAILLTEVQFQGQTMGMYSYECPGGGCTLTISEAIRQLWGLEHGAIIPLNAGILGGFSEDGIDSATLCDSQVQGLGLTTTCSQTTNNDLRNALPRCDACPGSFNPVSINFRLNVNGRSVDAYNHATEFNCIVPTEEASRPIDEFDVFLAPIQSAEVAAVRLLSQVEFQGETMGLYFYECPSSGCTLTLGEAISQLWVIEPGAAIPSDTGISGGLPSQGVESDVLCDTLLQAGQFFGSCNSLTNNDLSDLLPNCGACPGSFDSLKVSFMGNVGSIAEYLYNQGNEFNFPVSLAEENLSVSEFNAFLAPIQTSGLPPAVPSGGLPLVSVLTLGLISSGAMLLRTKG